MILILNQEPKKRKLPAILAFLLLFAGGSYFVQTTLAADISINSGSVEFGQGMMQSVACDDDISVRPISTFTNASGGSGAFYFSSLVVSRVSSSCNGKDLTIQAYGNSGSNPLALFNSTSTSVVIHKNNGGTFVAGAGTTGATVSSGSGTFTVTFTSPVALASAVFKITVESGEHTAIAYSVGDTGPGGGIVFYFSGAGFNCGSAFSATGSPTGGKCNYLEAAPRTWSGGAGDPRISWATNVNDNLVTSVIGAGETAIGSGYKNSLAIEAQSGNVAASSAAVAARAYRGGSKSDWYLPSKDELNELIRNRVVADALDGYWSSSEGAADGAWDQGPNGNQGLARPGKQQTTPVRPIRAF
jgi:hypothetical protein